MDKEIETLKHFPITDDCMYILGVGASRSGKTYLARHIMYKMIKRFPHKYRMIYIWSATVDCAGYKFCAKEFQSSKFQPEVLEEIIEMQKREIAECRTSGKEPRRVIILLDDCVGLVPFLTPQFQSLITTYRHFHTELVCLSQYLCKIPTFGRENASLVALFNLKIKLSINAAYESYGGCCFDSYDQWRDFLKRVATGHQALIIKQTQSSELKDNFFKFTAPSPEIEWVFKC